MIRTYSDIAERINNQFDNVQASDGGLYIEITINGNLIGSIGRDGAKQWKWLIKHKPRNENFSFYDRETMNLMANILNYCHSLDKEN